MSAVAGHEGGCQLHMPQQEAHQVGDVTADGLVPDSIVAPVAEERTFVAAVPQFHPCGVVHILTRGLSVEVDVAG